MKCIINFCLAGVFLMFTACQKSVTEEPTIFGRWLWVKSAGGVSGTTNYLPEGIKRILEFSSDYTFSYTENGVVFKKGIFSLGNVTDIFSNQHEPAVTFNPGSGSPLNHPQIISFENSNLRLKENCNDCYIHFFVPIE